MININRSIGISIFEEQIVRALFTSDCYELLKKLTISNTVYIFTNERISIFLSKEITLHNINNIRILVLNEYKEKLIIRPFYFFFRWSDPSTGTLRNLHRERENRRITALGLVLRLTLFYSLRNSISLKKIVRKLFFYTFSVEHFKSLQVVKFPKLDVLFATAITNTESDLPICLYYKKNKTPIIGTLRSWDNLVTKGTLKFEPDKFISHSKYMTDTAIGVHGLNKKTIVQAVTPSYQRKFLKIKTKNSELARNVTYGCIGPILNPDELNFIELLGEISNEVDSIITVVQHPKFVHNLNGRFTGKINFLTFDYLTSSLVDYYSFLSSQDLVIASGTSFALDTVFVKTPLIGLSFDVLQQNYWLSHLRSYDFLPHSKQLFEGLNIQRIYNKKDLVNAIKSTGIYSYPPDSKLNVKELLGDIELNFNDLIIDLIYQFGQSSNLSYRRFPD